MTDLVFRGQNDQVCTSSFKVAEFFEKNHPDVVRAIDRLRDKLQSTDFQCDAKMSSEIIFEEHFEDIPQPNGGTKKGKYFIMNKDAFTLLAMGFTGKRVLEFKIAYINEFNKMEAELKSQQTKQLSAAESLLQSVQLLVAHERQLEILEHNQKNMQGALRTLSDRVYSMQFETDMVKQKINNEIDRYTVIGYCSAHNIPMTRKEAAIIGGACSRMCKKRKIFVESIADPRFGKVNTYPSELIAEAIKDRQTKQS